MKKEYIIQEIIDKHKAKTYLEIGTERGVSFLKIKIKNKIAIDPNFKVPPVKKFLSRIKPGMTKYFQMTSDAFFKDKAPNLFASSGIDLAFIDGLHTYEQTIVDLNNTLPYLNGGGIILLHDCNPPVESAATEKIEDALPVENGTRPWCGTVWKAAVQIRALRNDLDIFVLDCDFGVGVVQKKKPASNIRLSLQDIQEITYKDLDKNREEYLNLKDPEYFNTFIKD